MYEIYDEMYEICGMYDIFYDEMYKICGMHEKYEIDTHAFFKLPSKIRLLSWYVRVLV